MIVSLMKALGITALAFVLSLLMVSPLSFSATSIFSPPERQDFTISDFYTQVADRRPVRHLEDQIVLVDIGSMDREQIAQVISIISLCEPRSVGVDVMFEEPSLMGDEVDSVLIASIKELASVAPVVFPINVTHNDKGKYSLKSKPFFYNKLPSMRYGAANMPSKHEGGTIREMAVAYPPYESFPGAVVGTVDSDKIDKLKARGNKLETIDYASREYLVIPAEELIDRAEELMGKVVIIGSMNDKEDLHAVPLSSSMSGVLIQVAGVSTILGERYYSSPGKLWDWFMASFLCFVVTWLGLLVNVKVKGLVVRILQLILVYAAVQIGYSLYVDHRIIINFTYTLLMVTFGLFAADIWNGVHGVALMIRQKRVSRKSK